MVFDEQYHGIFHLLKRHLLPVKTKVIASWRLWLWFIHPYTFSSTSLSFCSLPPLPRYLLHLLLHHGWHSRRRWGPWLWRAARGVLSRRTHGELLDMSCLLAHLHWLTESMMCACYIIIAECNTASSSGASDHHLSRWNWVWKNNQDSPILLRFTIVEWWKNDCHYTAPSHCCHHCGTEGSWWKKREVRFFVLSALNLIYLSVSCLLS